MKPTLPDCTDDWFAKNPPINLVADVTFMDSLNGKAFIYGARADVVSFNTLIDGVDLICGAVPANGSESFKSGASYRVNLRLPTARAYDLNLEAGREIAFTVAGRDVIATGKIVA